MARARQKQDAPASATGIEQVEALFGGARTLRHKVETRVDAHDLIVKGIPGPAIKFFLGNLRQLPTDNAAALGKAFGMSMRTLQRKNVPTKTLSETQGGKVWKFAEILAHATRILGSQDEAETWMGRPAMALDQRRPIDLLATSAGADLVDDLLTRLEYGAYV